MNTAENGQACEFFRKACRDVTPEAERQVARVLYAPFEPDAAITRCCAAVLSCSERLRAKRFAGEWEQALFQQRRAFRRYCAVMALETSLPLSRITFEKTRGGRPYLAEYPGFWFSFSSCRYGFLGAWSSMHGVGVDLEDPASRLAATELAHRFFKPAEADAVVRAGGSDRSKIFFQLWTLKEAALKSIGEGLPYGLDAFEFELGKVPTLVQSPPEHGGADRFRPHLVDGMDGFAALVIREYA